MTGKRSRVVLNNVVVGICVHDIYCCDTLANSCTFLEKRFSLDGDEQTYPVCRLFGKLKTVLDCGPILRHKKCLALPRKI